MTDTRQALSARCGRWPACAGGARAGDALVVSRSPALPPSTFSVGTGGTGDDRRGRGSRPQSCGGCAPARAQRVAVDLRAAALGVQRALPADRRPRTRRPCGTRIAGVYRTGRTAAPSASTRTSRTIAAASSGCSAAPTRARPCRGARGLEGRGRFETAANGAGGVVAMMRSPGSGAPTQSRALGGAAALHGRARSAHRRRRPPASTRARASGSSGVRVARPDPRGRADRCAGARSPRTARDVLRDRVADAPVLQMWPA